MHTGVELENRQVRNFDIRSHARQALELARAMTSEECQQYSPSRRGRRPV